MNNILTQNKDLLQGRQQEMSSSGDENTSTKPSNGSNIRDFAEEDIQDTSFKGEETMKLKVPDIRFKKKESNLKKSYTNKELNEAVEAIKSGSVGTRRAAQMYGVPRSTLRNKVFKLSEMNRQNSQVHQEHSVGAGEGSESVQEDTVKTEQTPEQERFKLFEAKTTQGGNMSLSRSNNIWDDLRNKLSIGEPYGGAASVGNYADMLNPLNFPGTYPCFLPPYPALTGYEYINPYAYSMLLPYLPDLFKDFAQKRLELEQLHAAQLLSSSKMAASKVENGEKAQIDNLKVPAYKPASATRQSEEPTSSSESDKLRSSFLSHDNTAQAPSSSFFKSFLPFQPALKRPQPLDSLLNSKKCRNDTAFMPELESLTANSSNGSNGVGKKRPKRGQYRKYDSELLAQAVRAVQQGEMSVHRAGTFYGVPHSTLEYKVKERHLLRKKKLAQNAEGKFPTTTLTSTNSMSCSYSSDSSESDRGSSKSVDNENETNKTEPNSSAFSNTCDILNFSSNNFSLDSTASASDLLKKLHERAQKKAKEVIRAKNSLLETSTNKPLENQ